MFSPSSFRMYLRLAKVEISGESVSVDLVFDGDVDTAGLADYVVLCFTKWVHV